MPATFTLDDWEALSSHDKKGIRKLRSALFDFEPLAKFHMLGPTMVASLIAQGLAEEGPSSRPTVAIKGYRLTDKGWLASEWLDGNRLENFPEG